MKLTEHSAESLDVRDFQQHVIVVRQDDPCRTSERHGLYELKELLFELLESLLGMKNVLMFVASCCDDAETCRAFEMRWAVRWIASRSALVDDFLFLRSSHFAIVVHPAIPNPVVVDI